jgi:hypothetical protein
MLKAALAVAPEVVLGVALEAVPVALPGLGREAGWAARQALLKRKRHKPG